MSYETIDRLVGNTPDGERSNVFVECGCCGQYHRADFSGDCRNDDERYPVPPEDAGRVIGLEIDSRS